LSHTLSPGDLFFNLPNKNLKTCIKREKEKEKKKGGGARC
jgi:hypothetical protein